MGYIEDIFNKSPRDINAKDIRAFISRQIEENLNLDYKDIKIYSDFGKLSQHIAAFANSAGGLLILGISEKKQQQIAIYPDDITWGESTLKKEDLENQLLSKISPKIDGLRIFPVRKTKTDHQVIFLIDVPKSLNPPHMAGDNRYYQRLNFQKFPMEHYQVADLFGRRLGPVLRLRYEWTIKHSGIKNGQNMFRFIIQLFIINQGKLMARFPCLTISKPTGGYTGRYIGVECDPDFHKTNSPGEGWLTRCVGGAMTVIYPSDKIPVAVIRSGMYEEISEFPDFKVTIGLFADNFAGYSEDIFISGEEIKTKFEEARKAIKT